MVSEELPTEDIFEVSEELQMENALKGFRGVTDEGCP